MVAAQPSWVWQYDSKTGAGGGRLPISTFLCAPLQMHPYDHVDTFGGGPPPAKDIMYS